MEYKISLNKLKDDNIFYDDFYALVKDEMPAIDQQQKELVEAFKVFDRSGNGLISAKELHHVISSLGNKITLEEAEAIIKEHDVDNDGGVNYEEFVKLSSSGSE